MVVIKRFSCGSWEHWVSVQEIGTSLQFLVKFTALQVNWLWIMYFPLVCHTQINERLPACSTAAELAMLEQPAESICLCNFPHANRHALTTGKRRIMISDTRGSKIWYVEIPSRYHGNLQDLSLADKKSWTISTMASSRPQTILKKSNIFHFGSECFQDCSSLILNDNRFPGFWGIPIF